MKYTKKEFTITPSKGMSQKSIDEHLKLYDGYVTNTNKILEALESGSEKGYALMEMRRRYSFEYNGMKNHEYYFEQLEQGTKAMSDSSALMMAINAQWGSIDKWKEDFVELAKTRGVGWAMLTYDKETQQLMNSWVDEQHLGQLNGNIPVYCLDMWEHSFVYDYQPSGKASYIADYMDSTNWSIVEERFKTATK